MSFARRSYIKCRTCDKNFGYIYENVPEKCPTCQKPTRGNTYYFPQEYNSTNSIRPMKLARKSGGENSGT